MTTGISEVQGLTEVTGIDADALDGVFLDDDAFPRSAAPTGSMRSVDHAGNSNGNGHAHSHHAHANGNGKANGHALAAALRPGGAIDSTPDYATFARHLNQSIKTAAPLLAADAVALAVA